MPPLAIYIFGFFFSLILGIFVLKTGKKIEHRLFGVLALIIMFSILTNTLEGIMQNIIFMRLAYSIPAFMTPIALIWFEYFTKQQCNKKSYRCHEGRNR